MRRFSLFFLLIFLLSSCGEPEDSSSFPPPVTVRLMSMFGGADPNAETLAAAVDVYERETGNVVLNNSAAIDDGWKARVIADFSEGAEPDVLQYFSTNMSVPLIEAEKLVSIDEVRLTYPDFLSNLTEDAINDANGSVSDGKRYFAPTNGTWEAMFVNTDILRRAGVNTLPANWDEFIAACTAVKAAGLIPIACDLASEPNYLFEFLLYNYAGANLPKVNPADDAGADMIALALTDFKELYDAGFFPPGAAVNDRSESTKIFREHGAAFYPGGNWNRKELESGNLNPDTVKCVGFPARDASVRDTRSIIGGYSSGFAITRKAWNDVSKRGACAALVETILRDEYIREYTAYGLTSVPAKQGFAQSDDMSPFNRSCLETVENAPLIVSPAEDGWSVQTGAALFNGAIADMCAGKIDAEEAVTRMLLAE